MERLDIYILVTIKDSCLLREYVQAFQVPGLLAVNRCAMDTSRYPRLEGLEGQPGVAIETRVHGTTLETCTG